MKISTILTLIESIENDESYTYKEIKEGKPYQLYFNKLLKSKYEFMKYLNDNGFVSFDLDYIKEQDKLKYEDVIKEI